MEVEKAKKSWFWRNFSAMITENKAGVMALSYSRFLGFITFVIWATLIVLFVVGSTEKEPPDQVLYVLSMFVLGKAAKDTAKAFKGGSSFTTPGE